MENTLEQKKYITVNIKIPLEINTDGSYTILNEYLDMEFIKCEKPCIKPENKQEFSNKFQEIFSDIMRSNIPSPEILVKNIVILKDEIKKKSSRIKNTSFKNRNGKSHNFTNKNYDLY